MINVFCLHLPTDVAQQSHYLTMLRVAIYTCVTKTSLKPVLLHSSKLPFEMNAWIHDQGVTTIDHEVSFADRLRLTYKSADLEFALGTYMRCDIPTLFPDEERVLYTDTDVIFKKDPVKQLNNDLNNIPLAMCREIGPVPGGYCTSDWMRNSGVIIFNNRWFRDNPVDFGAYGTSKNWKFNGFDQKVFSQGLINNLFPLGTYSLPPEFNWRPYQGSNEHQIITHYHMFKPDSWNHQVTDYLLRTSYINDSIVESSLDYAGASIRKSVEEFRRLNVICQGGFTGTDYALTNPHKSNVTKKTRDSIIEFSWISLLCNGGINVINKLRNELVQKCSTIMKIPKLIRGLPWAACNAYKKNLQAIQIIKLNNKYDLLDENWYRSLLAKSPASRVRIPFVPSVHFAYYGLKNDQSRNGIILWIAYIYGVLYYLIGLILNNIKRTIHISELTKISIEKNVGNSLSTDIRAIALYLPQYHIIPENNQWWGKNFTEWTNVKKSLPRFSGHYQPHIPHPDLGYYDLSNEKVLETQAQLAKSHGIEGFCFYYYWFKGKRLLEMPTDRMIASGKPDLPFCFCWANENWTRTWDGGDHEVLMSQEYCEENNQKVIYDLLSAFRDSRYIRIDKKPLFIVYRPLEIPNFSEVAELWRKICREEGVGEIYLCGMQSHSYLDQIDLGLDALIQFTPGPTMVTNVQEIIGFSGNDNISGGVFDINELILKNAYRPDSRIKEFYGICPSWDNTARRGDRGSTWINSSPEKYYKWLKAIVGRTREKHVKEEKVIFINAWNEWGEGAHLEPDIKYGYAWLNATKKALLED